MTLALNDNIERRGYQGQLEFIIKDKLGNIISHIIYPNIIKIFAKEVLSHRAGSPRVWSPTANSGAGAWVSSLVDPNDEFAIRYIIFGASYDSDGIPLDVNDPRFYTIDLATQTPIPVRLTPGATNGGGIINAIPVAEPNRPLKRVENITFSPTYQPAGTPQLQDDVRAINNIVTYETVLKDVEYNGFGLTGSDFFTITEVGLVAAKEIGPVGACELDPKELFLEGASSQIPLLASANGTDTISLDPSVTNVNIIKTGDQIKLTAPGSTNGTVTLDQISSFYLVINKQPGGRDIQIDRVPTDDKNNPIIGQIGVFRDTFRLVAHRILSSPLKKTAQLEITCRWSIIFS